MLRPCATLVAAVALLLIAATPVRSQARGGVYIQSYPGYGFYPYYGYNGFYSNGFSRYGPPVPTYAPVPGYFGGADQRLNNGYFGGPYYPSPRPSRAPGHIQPLPAEFDRQVTELPQGEGRASVVLEVRLPEPTAEVRIDGEATSQTGAVRTFQSPPLDKGKQFQYEVQARWTHNGQPMSRTETVMVEAGQRVQIDFRGLDPAANETLPAPSK